MNSMQAWNKFLKTGAIEDYLTYSRCRKTEAEVRDIYENQNTGPGSERNEYKR